MARYDVNRIPPTSQLIAFESVARLGSISSAARELGRGQSGVSRHISELERRLQAKLFNRSPSGVDLTEAGRRYRDAAVIALGALSVEGEEAARTTGRRRLVIACSHDVSYLLLMPKYEALKAALGEPADIRFKTYQRHAGELAETPAADIVLKWGVKDATPGDSVSVLRETVRPVCSPAYAEDPSDHVHGPARGWGPLTLLELHRPNQGWATWRDWFGVTGVNGNRKLLTFGN